MKKPAMPMNKREWKLVHGVLSLLCLLRITFAKSSVMTAALLLTVEPEPRPPPLPFWGRIWWVVALVVGWALKRANYVELFIKFLR